MKTKEWTEEEKIVYGPQDHSKRIVNLLIPKEFRVYCLPNKTVGEMEVTMYPSKSTCANCLSKIRNKKHGKFRVRHAR